MIPFFRKIRYRLAKDNQFYKYSRYAIGEIILVVVGILIALQINTWQKDKSTRKLEISTLKEIQRTLIQDTTTFTSNINDLFAKEKEIKIILNHIEQKMPYNPKIDTLMMSAYYHRGYKTINLSAYELLKERGIDIVLNDTLRKKISIYYSNEYADLIGVLDRLEKVNLIQGEKMYDHFKVSITSLKPYNYDELLENPKLMGPFYHFETLNSAYIENLTNFKVKSVSLLEAINLELEKRSSS